MHQRLTVLARKLRRDSTDAEKKLWYALCNRQLEGCKFRRQQPIGKYIVDFVNYEKKLVIEIDGSQHMDQQALDRERENWLRSKGFEIIRFWNNDIFENMNGVLEAIRKRL